MEKRRNCSKKAISPVFHNFFNISRISRVQLHIYLLNVVNRISFSSVLQIWCAEVRISRSISESPLEFEITRVTCISRKSHNHRTQPTNDIKRKSKQTMTDNKHTSTFLCLLMNLKKLQDVRQTMQMLIRRRVRRRLIWVYIVCSCSSVRICRRNYDMVIHILRNMSPLSPFSYMQKCKITE